MIKSLLLLIIFGYVWGGAVDAQTEHSALFSNIAKDEDIVFFPTSAWLNKDQTNWMVPIHGWVYEPQESRVRKRVVSQLLEKTYGISITDEDEPNFSNRVNLLLADNERSKNIVINLAGQKFLLPASDEHGHFETILQIPVSDLSHADQGLIDYTAVLEPHDKRDFIGSARLIKPLGKSVISDIDDTVKLSYVTDRTRLIEATFRNDFVPVEGMTELYKKWEQQGTRFHFVSSSPWQLFSPLNDFLLAYDFPWATMSLKKIRFRDQTILDLFKKGTETKPQAIQAILQRYPNRSFVLIGDSGEQDAQVYAAIAEQNPHQIDMILIRDVGNKASLADEYQKIFSKINADKWQLFVSPSDIKM